MIANVPTRGNKLRCALVTSRDIKSRIWGSFAHPIRGNRAHLSL